MAAEVDRRHPVAGIDEGGSEEAVRGAQLPHAGDQQDERTRALEVVGESATGDGQLQGAGLREESLVRHEATVISF